MHHPITGRSVGRRDACPHRHCPHPRTGRSARHDFRLWDPIDYILLHTSVTRAAAELFSRIRVVWQDSELGHQAAICSRQGTAKGTSAFPVQDQQVKVETRHHLNLFHGIRD